MSIKKTSENRGVSALLTCTRIDRESLNTCDRDVPPVTILLRPPARILERHELPSDEALLHTQCGGVFGERARGSA